MKSNRHICLAFALRARPRSGVRTAQAKHGVDLIDILMSWSDSSRDDYSV